MITFKVNDVEITAIRDRAMFNTFANNTSYIIDGIGDEFSAIYNYNSLNVEIGSGEAVICGGSCSGNENDTITLGANESGYIVIRIDLTQSTDNVARIYKTPTLSQENINDGNGVLYDFPLYYYITGSGTLSSIEDRRVTYHSASQTLTSTINGKAPTNHASSVSTYGLGTTANYGHVKTINGLTQASHQNGTALSAYQGKVLNDKVNGKAPTNHASTATTYGLGTTTNYGHVKTVNALTQSTHQDGTALSAYQGKVLNDKVTTLTNNFNALFKSIDYRTSYTIPANSYKNLTEQDFGIWGNVPSGYSAIAFSAVYSGNHLAIPFRMMASAGYQPTGIVLALANHTSNQISGTAVINILYIKSQFVEI